MERFCNPPICSTVEAEAREMLADGHKVAVVSFLHSYLNDDHEKARG